GPMFRGGLVPFFGVLAQLGVLVVCVSGTGVPVLAGCGKNSARVKGGGSRTAASSFFFGGTYGLDGKSVPFAETRGFIARFDRRWSAVCGVYGVYGDRFDAGLYGVFGVYGDGVTVGFGTKLSLVSPGPVPVRLGVTNLRPGVAGWPLADGGDE